MFTGFPEETTRFLLDLRYHNSADFFNANRERYVRDVQEPFYAFIGDMVPVIQEIDPDMESRPYKLLARIRRDTRFSKDKSPYRDHLWVWFKHAGEERWMSLGFWFEFGPRGVGWGMGTWGENRPMMDMFRRELAAHPRRVGGIIASCGLEERGLALTGDRFRRIDIPQGVPEHLKRWYVLKDPSVQQTRPDMDETGSRAVFAHCAADYRAMAPLYRLLRGMKDASEEPPAEAGAPRAKRQDEW